MNISPYLSSKITLFYTLLIVMVVYIHSTYLEMYQYKSSDFVLKFFGGAGVVLCSQSVVLHNIRIFAGGGGKNYC